MLANSIDELATLLELTKQRHGNVPVRICGSEGRLVQVWFEEGNLKKDGSLSKISTPRIAVVLTGAGSW